MITLYNQLVTALANLATLIARLTTTRMGYIDKLINGTTSIKNIQRGTFTIAGAATSGAAVITAVVLAKSELRLLGKSCATLADGAIALRISLTGTTTITGTLGTAGTGITTVSYEVVEYN